jgi:DNA-3-methyladenine glycosylase
MLPDTLPDNRLERAFYARPTLLVARDLLGMRLVRLEGERRLVGKARIVGYITETEAYIGQADLGCHARAGFTPRTRVMYGPPGCAYVYFNYGLHWMLNFVTETQGFPAAVLIRGMFPVEGIEHIARRRGGQPRRRWTDGPAKLCQALGIAGSLNGVDTCTPQAEIYVEPGLPVPPESVTTGPRVGLNSVPEPWKSIPWRFVLKNPAELLRGLCQGS